eukprot:Lankesteria_metandrocarpae@DN1228_c0_g1_i1.p1
MGVRHSSLYAGPLLAEELQYIRELGFMWSGLMGHDPRQSQPEDLLGGSSNTKTEFLRSEWHMRTWILPLFSPPVQLLSERIARVLYWSYSGEVQVARFASYANARRQAWAQHTTQQHQQSRPLQGNSSGNNAKMSFMLNVAIGSGWQESTDTTTQTFLRALRPPSVEVRGHPHDAVREDQFNLALEAQSRVLVFDAALNAPHTGGSGQVPVESGLRLWVLPPLPKPVSNVLPQWMPKSQQLIGAVLEIDLRILSSDGPSGHHASKTVVNTPLLLPSVGSCENLPLLGIRDRLTATNESLSSAQWSASDPKSPSRVKPNFISLFVSFPPILPVKQQMSQNVDRERSSDDSWRPPSHKQHGPPTGGGVRGVGGSSGGGGGGSSGGGGGGSSGGG